MYLSSIVDEFSLPQHFISSGSISFRRGFNTSINAYALQGFLSMSSKQFKGLEKSLYEPIKSALYDKFAEEYRVHLEVSAEGRISEVVKETLDDV